MLERVERALEEFKNTALAGLKFVEGPKPEDFRGLPLKNGHSKKYRGKHRSHVKGKGFFADWRRGGE